MNRSTTGRLAFAAILCVFALPPTVHWNQQQQLFAGDPATGDGFGVDVSISGDTVVAGSFGDDTPAGGEAGSAYVFSRTDGVWSQQAHLYASDASASDFFGVAVGISGDRIVIGARSDETPAGTYAGSVYPFVRSGNTWSPDGHLYAGDPAASDQFGYSVGISGETAVVGVPWDDTASGSDAGSVYAFRRGSVVWYEQGHLFPNDPGMDDQFGKAVAISADTIVAGAQYWDGPSANGTGCAYVFTRNAGTWSQQARLVADDFEPGDEFGCAVAISGDLVVVGSCQDDTVAGSDAGSVYVFARSGSIWTQQAHLYAADAVSNDHFGAAVGISGKRIVVGAWADDTAIGNYAGSAYVFGRVGGVWTQQDHIFAGDPEAGDEFGSALAISGDTVVVGVPEDTTPGGSNAGSAYIYVENFFDTWVGEPTTLLQRPR
jgi:hypothetical protein